MSLSGSQLIGALAGAQGAMVMPAITDGYNGALLWLFLAGGVGEEDAAFCLLFTFLWLDHHAISQWTDLEIHTLRTSVIRFVF